MPQHSSRRRREQSGIVIPLTAILLTVIVPLIGLGIDASILYAVKTKMSAACDAAALAGARSLARGVNDAAQVANAQSVAEQYVALDFPAGYFGAPAPTVPTPTVDESQSQQRSVTVSASLAAPTFFMNWLGVSAVNISDSATAVRRDINVVLVMDTSGSLSLTNSCGPLKTAAVDFVSQFSEGRDEVGLATFSGASQAYPGIEFPLSTSFSSMTTTIGNITCVGGTSTALGLYNGYQALLALNQPAALNAILLFTDGYPTDITTTFPHNSGDGDSCEAPSTNTHQTLYQASPGGTAMTGATVETTYSVGDPSNPATWSPVGWTGLYQPNDYPNDTAISSNGHCTFGSNTGEIASIPATDPNYSYLSMVDGQYQPVTYVHGSSTQLTMNETNLLNGSINEADSMAYYIRTQTALPNVIMYSIGLGNAGGVPADFLERVANDPRASNYNASYPVGEYVSATSSADLEQAFLQIASEMLRLSK